MATVLAGSSEEQRQAIIKECKEKLKQHGELIPRKTKIQNTAEVIGSSNATEKEQERLGSGNCDCQNKQPNDRSFKVMQWNILADALADSTPDSNFNKVPPGCLEWSYRQPRVIEHILTINADIVCLEEVDHFSDTFEPLFTKVGFNGMFQPKKASPCLNNPVNNGPDGIALFYRSNRYECQHAVKSYLKGSSGEESNQPIIICCLEDKLCRKNLVVGVVHLKAKPGFEDLRQIQAKDAVAKIIGVQKEKQWLKSTILLTGDFNGEHKEPFYDTIAKHPEVHLTSAYRRQLGEEVPFTTWKFRDSKEYKRTIDYMWYSEASLVPCAYLDMPNEMDVPEFRFPSWSHPSDHMSLCCDFQFL